MTAHRMRARLTRVASLGLTTLVAVSLVLSTSFSADAARAEKAKPSKLGPHDLELISAARAKGESTILVLIASSVGRNSSVASAVAALGGTIRYRDDDLDYVRARISIDAAEKVAALAGIDAVDVDEIIPLELPSPEGTVGIISQPAPGAATPNNNPYMPTRDTGAAQFLAAHPTWDGRGITIGQVDTGIGLDHPALQTTTTGERKIIGWVTGTDPIDDNDPTWINMAAQVTGPTFTLGTPAVTYTAPAAESYRFGIFDERDTRFGGELGRDANRDGNPTGSSGLFGVLWNTTTDQVWVDTDQDLSFADQTAMQNYNVNYDIGWFGTDNPATAIAERLPFVVQTDAVNGYVNIGVPSGIHATHVAGIMAANGMFGGAMTGAAPGAKLVSSRACLFIAGCTAHALLEGMIDLVKNMNVDVVNMSIGGLPALNDGNNTRAQVYDRLIEKSKVQLFISAGNSGPGINTIGDPSVATKVVSVGAYITQSTYLADYGTDPGKADNLLYFTSRGPREDGGFKPDIVAPGAAVSTTPLWAAGSGLPYTLPVGYQLQNGTSMASPAAAGASALLLSAAKANLIPAKPDQLRQALRSTARYLDPSRFQPYDQGNGLIDIVAAWDLLKTNIKTVDISSSVPVNTVLSGFLATPGVGVGIYDREGVSVGTAYTRTYKFSRGNGDGATATYNLSWVGNDGTFSIASSSITLAKRGSANVVVTINAASAGAHSAILNVDDPATAGIDYQVMNTVIAPLEFTAAGNFTQLISSTIDRAQAKHYFFRVPAGTPALKVDFSGPTTTAGTGQARFLRWHPYGLAIDDNAVSNCYQPPQTSCGTGSPTSRTTSNPLAGVWEVSVDARRTSDADNAPFALTASILGATVSPNPDVIASATIGVPIARSYTITNQFGAFTGRAVGTTLGSARRGVFTIANHATQEYLVTVTAGTTSLRATIGGTSDPAADLDLFVYQCPTPTTCVLRGQSADGDSEESVTLASPAAGDWKVVINGFAVPAGTTTYNYIDVFVNPAFGSISITDADALRPSGASWAVPGSVTANAAPATGRVLYGNIQVRTNTNVLVGSGDVIVNSVAP